MARKEMELEKGSASVIERLLLFFIPIVFTIVLVVALLTLFNTDFKNGLFKIADKIPVVKNWVPTPELTPEEKKAANGKAPEAQSVDTATTLDKLKSELSRQEVQLQQNAAAKAEQDKKVQQLETQLQNAIAKQGTAAAVVANSGTNQDPYLQQIKNLSSMYETMSPSKAAAILTNLTNPEIVQLLTYMAPENQAKIFAKMNPQKAAEITMDLKNATNSSDLKVAALQSRLKQVEQSASAATPVARTIDDKALGSTFAAMDPVKAADLILQTYKISPAKVLNILRVVDDATRSRLLGEMSKKDSAQASQILNRLLANK